MLRILTNCRDRALVQITGASETRRIHRYFIVLRGPFSKQQAQRYL
jgi:hypothetical protein